MDTITIEPQSGLINPKSHQCIKFTLYASKIPAEYEGELECFTQVVEINGKGKPEQMHLRIRKQATFVN
jgi:hypothetical protein